MAGALSIRCEAGDFERLRARVSDWDNVLQDTLRVELGAAARPAARLAARNVLRSSFPATRPARRRHGGISTGLRSELANSVNVVLREAGDGVEFRITSSHQMSVPTNSNTWRHPVFGDRDTWISQRGSQWFSRAMVQSRPEMQRAADKALDRAVRRIK